MTNKTNFSDPDQPRSTISIIYGTAMSLYITKPQKYFSGESGLKDSMMTVKEERRRRQRFQVLPPPRLVAALAVHPQLPQPPPLSLLVSWLPDSVDFLSRA